MTAYEAVLSLTDDQRRDVMKAPDEVSAMLRLRALGWGSKRIAAELGCARNTVRRWLAEGDWRAFATASRSKKLDGLSDWIAERFHRHAGNADVVRQELASEKSLVVSLRTVERATAPYAGNWLPRRGRRCVLRPTPASSCRSISANAVSRSAVLRSRCSSSWRHSATRAGCM
jgi:Homeodomain-like domain